MEKVSGLIRKEKLRLHQFSAIDPSEIVISFDNEEINKLWEESEPWQRACSNFLGEINNSYSKHDWIWLLKRSDWILPHIVGDTPITGAPAFYVNANDSEKAGKK